MKEVFFLKKVAVEKGLSNVQNFLTQQGITVETLDTQNKANSQYLSQYDAIVVSSLDNNVMGITNTLTKIPIINASGLTPQDVYNQIQNQM